jgi:hypothetical protein
LKNFDDIDCITNTSNYHVILSNFHARQCEFVEVRR